MFLFSKHFSHLLCFIHFDLNLVLHIMRHLYNILNSNYVCTKNIQNQLLANQESLSLCKMYKYIEREKPVAIKTCLSIFLYAH